MLREKRAIMSTYVDIIAYYKIFLKQFFAKFMFHRNYSAMRLRRTKARRKTSGGRLLCADRSTA